MTFCWNLNNWRFILIFNGEILNHTLHLAKRCDIFCCFHFWWSHVQRYWTKENKIWLVWHRSVNGKLIVFYNWLKVIWCIKIGIRKFGRVNYGNFKRYWTFNLKTRIVLNWQQRTQRKFKLKKLSYLLGKQYVKLNNLDTSIQNF